MPVKIIIIFMVIISSRTLSQTFILPIHITDSLHSKSVYLGVHPNATTGFDQGLDTLAPPPPPAGSFDCRFTFESLDYYADIRTNSLEQKIFYLSYTPSSGQSVFIEWDNDSLSKYGQFIIKDNLTGNLFSMNMILNNSLNVSQYNILSNSLRIEYVPSNLFSFTDKDLLYEFYLYQNYPNPFNPATNIKYSIPVQSRVVVKIIDALGREIENIMNEEKPAGSYEITWNATNLSSGVYFCQLKAGEFIQTKKMLLMK